MKIKTSALTPILILVALLVAAMVVPIGNTNDIYLSVMVEKPACENILCTGDTPAKIIDITGYATQHTLLEPPYLADLISSGTLKLSAEAGTIKNINVIGTILKGTSGTYKMTLRDVPRTQTNVTVKLSENNAIVDTRSVIVTEVI